MSGSREYADLFKRRYAAGRAWLAPLSEGDQARLAELERLLPIEMIKKRRTATWRHLYDEDQGKDHRQRDLAEMEAELNGIVLEQWGVGKAQAKARRADNVLYKGWMMSEAKEKKSLRSRYVVVVDVKSLADTHHSGWMLLKQRRNDKKEVWDRFWFRLRGKSLYYFSDMDDTKPRKEVSLSTVSHVQGVEGTVDTFEIAANDRKYLCKCDTSSACTAWTEAFVDCFARAGEPQSFYRWLLVFKADSSSAKPVSVMPLASRSYTWTDPKESVKDAEKSAKVLRVGMLDFSVRQCVLAHKESSQFQMLADILEADAAELLNEGTGGQDVTSLSANQQALLEVDDDEDDDDDDEEEEEDGFEQTAAAAAAAAAAERGSEALDHLRNRVIFQVGRVIATAGIEDRIDWVAVDLMGLKVEASNTANGAYNAETQVANLVVEDRYTRDTCFPKLLYRSGGDSEPIIRFRYKKTFRDDIYHSYAPGASKNLFTTEGEGEVSAEDFDGGSPGAGGRASPTGDELSAADKAVESDVFVQLIVQVRF